MKNNELFNLENTIAKNIFLDTEYPYEVLDKIADYIITLGESLPSSYIKTLDKNNLPLWIHENVKIGDYVTIEGPAIIDEGTEIRHCAYIRGNVIVGKDCIIGNSCELKNSLLFDSVQIPHFNYVGDSIIGYKSHLGSSVILSNVKSSKSLVTIKYNNKIYSTKRYKVGSFIGDYAEIGCSSVINPGTVIGKNTTIYPLLSVRGVIGANSLLKSTDPLVLIKKD